jgi:hypothetical protein
MHVESLPDPIEVTAPAAAPLAPATMSPGFMKFCFGHRRSWTLEMKIN